MNNLKIKVNGMEISLENSKPAINPNNELDTMVASISSESEMLCKQIKAINMLSDIKTVESFGYKSTEGVGQSIKNAATAAGHKIIEILNKIKQFFQKLFAHITSSVNKQRVNKVEDQGLKTKFQQVYSKITEGLKNYDKTTTETLKQVQAAINSNDEALQKKAMNPAATEIEKQRVAILSRANKVASKYLGVCLQYQSTIKDAVKNNASAIAKRVNSTALNALDSTLACLTDIESKNMVGDMTKEAIDETFAPVISKLDEALKPVDELYQDVKKAFSESQNQAPSSGNAAPAAN